MNIPVYENGEIVDVVQGNCVAGDEMCQKCWIALLERLELNAMRNKGMKHENC
jgi:hypothetical protein